MYAHLTKKEKQKKLALARKRAILWSSQEQRKKQLQATAPVLHLPSSVEPPFYPAYSDPPPELPPSLTNTSIPDNTTIAALQASISDLLEQREQLDITIRVLSRRLEALLAQTRRHE